VNEEDKSALFGAIAQIRFYLRVRIRQLSNLRRLNYNYQTLSFYFLSNNLVKIILKVSTLRLKVFNVCSFSYVRRRSIIYHF